MAMEIISNQPKQPRGWTQTVDEYLADHGISYTSATPLPGGISAYVWRIEGYYKHQATEKDNLTDEPCVLKYAEETASGAPQYNALDAERMRFEVRALRSGPVARACEAEPSVQVPRVLETTNRALLMSWGGDVNLRTAYIDRRTFDEGKVASRLGWWLASMHSAGLRDNDICGFENSSSDVVVASEHHVLREAMLQAGLGQKEIEAAVARLKSSAGRKTLISWDFRPMNTLLRFCGDGEPSLTIVDWEASKYGCPVDDVRFWVAEVLVLEAKYGTCRRRMVTSFLSAYRQQADKEIVTEGFVYKLALSVGSILLLMVPAGMWASGKAEIEFWKARAMQFVRAGLERDLKWLAASELAPLM
jgi:tRNA A-37 threonylcarbamoyl transferase component Bud32